MLRDIISLSAHGQSSVWQCRDFTPETRRDLIAKLSGWSPAVTDEGHFSYDIRKWPKHGNHKQIFQRQRADYDVMATVYKWMAFLFGTGHTENLHQRWFNCRFAARQQHVKRRGMFKKVPHFHIFFIYIFFYVIFLYFPFLYRFFIPLFIYSYIYLFIHSLNVGFFSCFSFYYLYFF